MSGPHLFLHQLAAIFPMDTTGTQNKRNIGTFNIELQFEIIIMFLDVKFHQFFSSKCFYFDRSLFSNFSIDSILSENLAGEQNVKIVDVNVLKKIKQEKIELLGGHLTLSFLNFSKIPSKSLLLCPV